MDEEPTKPMKVAACGCICCSPFMLVGFILLCCSFKTLPQYRYGLKKHSSMGKVDLTQVWEPGVHGIGFWNEFLEFPSTIQTLSYATEGVEEGAAKLEPLVLRSKDKVPMTLEISVQYTRRREELPELFQMAMAEIQQENIFASRIRAELTKVMGDHNSADCWLKRSELISELFAACQKVLSTVHADCWGLQFYRSHMSEKYEDELIQTQVQKQEQRIALAKQEVKNVEASTEVLLAEYGKNQTIIESSGAAARYQIEQAAKTEAEAGRIGAEANALNFVKSTLTAAAGIAMTDTQFTDYQKRITLQGLKSAPLFYSLSATPAFIAVPGTGGRRLDPTQHEL